MVGIQKFRNSRITERWKNDPRNVPIKYHRVLILIDMAEHDVHPDGSFSDAECTLWEEIHNAMIHREENVVS